MRPICLLKVSSKRGSTDGLVDVFSLVGVADIVRQDLELLLEELVVPLGAYTHVEFGVREELVRAERDQRKLAYLGYPRLRSDW